MLGAVRWLMRLASLSGAGAGAGAFLVAFLAIAPAAHALKVDEIVTPKGIKAWLVEEHAVPLIAIKFAFVGGATQDPSGKEGLAGLISDVMSEGAGDLPACGVQGEARPARHAALGVQRPRRLLRGPGIAERAVCAFCRAACG